MAARSSFDAGHTIPELEACARPGHGHHYDVEVAVVGDLDPKTGWPRGAEDLPIHLDLVCGELRGEDLTAMIPGVATSALGIAAYIQERLLLRFPRLLSVGVECSDGTRGTVKRTQRQ